MQCIEDASGTRCTAKSLERFDGAPTPLTAYNRAPGAPVTIDVLYGDVTVIRSPSPQVEVQFFPFVYAGHDESVSARNQLAQNLRVGVVDQGGALVASVARQGGSNGLGANVLVRLPDNFDGPLNIVNRGGGPINQFDVKVDYVGRAPALSVINQADLGDCNIHGAPTVRQTTVQCRDLTQVYDVSGQVNISNDEARHDGPAPLIVFRAAGPGLGGGRISSASGSIAVSMPRTGGYVVDASSPVRGTVQEGSLPTGCNVQAKGPNAKTITCGAGPRYEVLAGTAPNHIGQPKDSNVQLSYY